jgi:hypothetical protein
VPTFSRLAAVACAVGLVMTWATCGSTKARAVAPHLAQTRGLRVFDPSGSIRATVTSADVVRSSVRAVKFAGSPVIIVPLRSSGSAKFCALTRGLARRGARLANAQHLAVEVAGRIYARPCIDYTAFPARAL